MRHILKINNKEVEFEDLPYKEGDLVEMGEYKNTFKVTKVTKTIKLDNADLEINELHYIPIFDLMMGMDSEDEMKEFVKNNPPSSTKRSHFIRRFRVKKKRNEKRNN